LTDKPGGCYTNCKLTKGTDAVANLNKFVTVFSLAMALRRVISLHDERLFYIK
jgi:hypothetical protein